MNQDRVRGRQWRRPVLGQPVSQLIKKKCFEFKLRKCIDTSFKGMRLSPSKIGLYGDLILLNRSITLTSTYVQGLGRSTQGSKLDPVKNRDVMSWGLTDSHEYWISGCETSIKSFLVHQGPSSTKFNVFFLLYASFQNIKQPRHRGQREDHLVGWTANPGDGLSSLCKMMHRPRLSETLVTGQRRARIL